MENPNAPKMAKEVAELINKYDDLSRHPQRSTVLRRPHSRPDGGA